MDAAGGGGGDAAVSGDRGDAASGDRGVGLTAACGTGCAGAVDGPPPGFRAYTTGLDWRRQQGPCTRRQKKRYSLRPVTMNVPVLKLLPHPHQENLHLLRRPITQPRQSVSHITPLWKNGTHQFSVLENSLVTMPLRPFSRFSISNAPMSFSRGSLGHGLHGSL